MLLHPTSLPSGQLGSEARGFADFLAAAGQRWWQMLPVGPTGYGNSPYSALSAFAGNPALVSLERLAEDGLIGNGEAHADLETALRAAFRRFGALPAGERAEHDAFCEANRAWLEDFALYRALKRQHGEVQWTRWAPEYRDRQPAALDRARRSLAEEIAFYAFEQYRFDRDWQALRAHCGRRGIGLIGDIPIFVAHDSADVWQHRELFYLDAAGEPTVIVGTEARMNRPGLAHGNWGWKMAEGAADARTAVRLRTLAETYDRLGPNLPAERPAIERSVGLHKSAVGDPVTSRAP